MCQSTFKITGIELMELPADSGYIKLTVIFQSNGTSNGTASDRRMFGSVIPSATHTMHINNPDPEVLKTFIDAFYTKKLFECDFGEGN